MPGFLVHPSDDEHVRDARLAGAGHDRIAVVVELRHVDVAVAVDQDESD